MATAEIKRHWEKVSELGCLITGRTDAVIHHCMGGSMKENGYHKGMGQKPSDWLVIPLSPVLHNGDLGIHTIGVLTWENNYGKQFDFLKRVSDETGVNIFEKCINENDRRGKSILTEGDYINE